MSESVSASTCASCGLAFGGRFCSSCGERRLDHHDYSFGHFLSHSFHDIFHLDAKIFRSIRTLLAKPGLLSGDYFDGRRVGMLSPVQMFVMINILFFFIAPRLGLFRFGYDYFAGNERVLIAVRTKPLLEKARGERSVEEFRREFDAEIDHPKRLLIFTMVGLFAALAWLLMRRRKYYVEHVVFALHYYAFWMLLMIVVPALVVVIASMITRVGLWAFHAHTKIGIGDLVLIPLAVAASIIYLTAAIRRFYGYGRVAAAAFATFFSFAMIAIFLVYRGVLFLLALQLV